MKVLMLNGSPKDNGNTATALGEMVKIFEEEGVEVEIIRVGHLEVRGCVGCASCFKQGKCFMDDIVNEIAEKLMECDGLVIGSPVYYASANSTLTAILDRLVYSSAFDKRMKVGASVAVARRGGTSAPFDELNKYFTISGMPIAPSQSWNSVHGRLPGEAENDEEGMQNMRTIGRGIAWLLDMKKNAAEYPDVEKRIRTNFIR